MSGLLTQILDEVRLEYLELMRESGFEKPYVTAERLCHEKLFLDVDLLARVVEEDPTLLAARAGDHIMNRQEGENPAVGVIICANILAAALEGLLSIAVENNWLEEDEDGSIIVSSEELEQESEYPITADYSHSETARNNLTRPGASRLSTLFAAAEESFVDSLQQDARDAYQSALEVSSEFSIFAPDDIAPLVAENPLLLGLRPDGMIDEELFEGDPPAGIIISAHLTRMLLNQLLELGMEHGALATDSDGNIILPQDPEQKPTLH